MKKTFILLALIATFQVVNAQNEKVKSDSVKPKTPPQYVHQSEGIDLSKFYLDASVGLFPTKANGSWAGQASSGYRLNEQSAIGLGASTWGRNQIYKRTGLGIGLQYRHNYPERLIVKAEIGYLAMHKMKDGVLDKDMIYTQENSKPFYYKLEAHWRVWRCFTLGIAASQTGNLYFRRYIDNAASTLDLWRINAITIQLGVSFDENTMGRE